MLKAEASTLCLLPGTAERLATHSAMRGRKEQLLLGATRETSPADTCSQTLSLLPGKQHVCHLNQSRAYLLKQQRGAGG